MSYSGSPDAVRVSETEPRAVNIVTLDEKTGEATILREPLQSARAAITKTFFTFPGEEERVFETALSFLRDSGAKTRPVAVIEGLADGNALRRLKDLAEVREPLLAQGLAELRLKTEDASATKAEMINYSFLRKMHSLSETADTPQRRDMELSVITNGTCAGKEEAHFLAGLNPRAVAISLDAAKPELHDSIRGVSGAFKKALAFIEICRGENLPVSVITTVQKRNIGELAALRDLLLDKGLAWQIQTAGAEGGRFNRELLLTPEEFYAVGVFTASLRKNIPPKRLAAIGAHDLGYHSYLLPNLSLCDSWSGCQAGITVAGIRSDGGVYGCLAVNGGKCEGNVRERSFTDIWQDPSSFADTRGYTPDMPSALST